MAWSFHRNTPVYLQIAQRLKNEILRGTYPPGSQIPTVRALAVEAAVNPNTVQHAFAALESEGLLCSPGTQGRFVTEDEAVLAKCKHESLTHLTQELIRMAGEISVSKEELIHLIEEADV